MRNNRAPEYEKGTGPEHVTDDNEEPARAIEDTFQKPLKTPSKESSERTTSTPKEEKLDTQFRPQRTPNGERRVVILHLMRTTHEIHYR